MLAMLAHRPADGLGQELAGLGGLRGVGGLGRRRQRGRPWRPWPGARVGPGVRSYARLGAHLPALGDGVELLLLARRWRLLVDEVYAARFVPDDQVDEECAQHDGARRACGEG